MNQLFITACPRGEASRTLRLAERVRARLGGDWDRLDVYAEDIRPLTAETLAKRLALCARGDFSDPMFALAKRFRQAETVLIAAPYWDLSVPAALKALIEQLCVVGLTFAYGGDDQPYSLCALRRVVFVTTSGGPILTDSHGFGWIRDVMTQFFGAEDVRQVKAEGLDLRGADPERILADTPIPPL